MRLATDSTESNGLKPNAPMLLPSKGRVSVLNLLINYLPNIWKIPRNVGQASSSRTRNVNEVRIDGASEEAHAILGLCSGKVLVDPHTDHKRRKDPLEERDDHPSPTIIPEEDSEDEESRAEPNPEVYKPPVPYPQLLSRPRVLRVIVMTPY